MRNKKLRKISSIIFISVFIIIFHQSANAKFINLFITRVGGSALSPGDEYILAKYDIIFAQKSHYNDIGGDSWGAIKAINPNTDIYVYYQTDVILPAQNAYSTINLTSLGRYDVDRGHSMGDLNNDNTTFFLLDKEFKRIEWTYPMGTGYWLDFGNKNFYDYSIESTKEDCIDKDWKADGIFFDHMWAIESGVKETPLKYSTDELWTVAMNDYVQAMMVGISALRQKFATNRGMTPYTSGQEAWLALDASAHPPDVVLEETAFAVNAGSGDIQFFPEKQWKKQIDLLSAIKNSNVCFQSNTDLEPGESGTDNFSKSFTFWDGLWYALGSYLLGKNETQNNSFFLFGYSTNEASQYNNINRYYDEYDLINLGVSLSGYKISNYDGNNIYWREFEKGYVYVNPTLKDINLIEVPELCKQRTHDNLGKDLSTLKNIDTINLKSHRAAILYKSNHLALLNVPKNLRIIVR